MIAYVLSYLFDEPTHVNDIYERPGNKTQQWWTMPHVPGLRYGGAKPVYVLTSKNTFSGGEELAYDLQTLKRATLVGETTGGGAHPVQPYKVSEHFAIGVPYARAVNPITGTNWEGTGVAPDVATPADQALNTAYRMVLEKMLETASATTVRRRTTAGRLRGGEAVPTCADLRRRDPHPWAYFIPSRPPNPCARSGLLPARTPST
jgi:C-terminal processing protease CtpA/Prc